jgi:RND family efflux transporter MFP subunit
VLTTIVRMDPIYVYFDVDQRAAQQYRQAVIERRGAATNASAASTQPMTARDLNIPFQFGLASETDFPHEGIIDFIDNKIDPTTGTITVRGETKNGARMFKPGYFARVRVPAGQQYQAVLVNDRAIGTQQGQKYVLVVDEKEKVVFRPVTLGSAQPDGLRVVRSGLKPAERIVVNGIQRARPGTLVKAERGEMLAKPTTREVAAAQPVIGNP